MPTELTEERPTPFADCKPSFLPLRIRKLRIISVKIKSRENVDGLLVKLATYCGSCRVFTPSRGIFQGVPTGRFPARASPKVSNFVNVYQKEAVSPSFLRS